MQFTLIKLMLTLILATASLSSFSASNIAPVISGTPATSVVAGDSYIFQLMATDANGDRLKFSIRNKPAWARFSSVRGRLIGKPRSADVGTYSDIVISVSDRKTSVNLPAFSIQVQAAGSTSGSTTYGSATGSGSTASVINTVPVISGTPTTSVMAGSAYSFQPTATDVDRDSLSFSISNKPTWASFSSSTGRLSGTPRYQRQVWQHRDLRQRRDGEREPANVQHPGAGNSGSDRQFDLAVVCPGGPCRRDAVVTV
jgi:hypothetical protein